VFEIANSAPLPDEQYADVLVARVDELEVALKVHERWMAQWQEREAGHTERIEELEGTVRGDEKIMEERKKRIGELERALKERQEVADARKRRIVELEGREITCECGRPVGEGVAVTAGVGRGGVAAEMRKALEKYDWTGPERGAVSGQIVAGWAERLESETPMVNVRGPGCVAECAEEVESVARALDGMAEQAGVHVDVGVIWLRRKAGDLREALRKADWAQRKGSGQKC
jgi:hypothetical protein